MTKFSAWALIGTDEYGNDPRKRDWWGFDIYRTRREAHRVKSIGEKVVRVRVEIPKKK